MQEKALPLHKFLFFILLIASTVFYGSYGRLVLEIKTIGYTQSQALIGPFWVWVIYCLRSQLTTPHKILVTLQQMATPWLVILLAASAASSIKNFLACIHESPTSIPYPIDFIGFFKYALFARAFILLIIQVVIPTFIALTTLRALKEKLRESSWIKKFLRN